MLQVCKDIETTMGREQTHKRWPRCIDIDIILYNNIHINQPWLHIPHKHYQERDFVLQPLLALDPTLQDPLTWKHLKDILETLEERTIIQQKNNIQYT